MPPTGLTPHVYNHLHTKQMCNEPVTEIYKSVKHTHMLKINKDSLSCCLRQSYLKHQHWATVWVRHYVGVSSQSRVRSRRSMYGQVDHCCPIYTDTQVVYVALFTIAITSDKVNNNDQPTGLISTCRTLPPLTTRYIDITCVDVSNYRWCICADNKIKCAGLYKLLTSQIYVNWPIYWPAHCSIDIYCLDTY